MLISVPQGTSEPNRRFSYAYLVKSASDEHLIGAVRAGVSDPGGGNVVVGMPSGILEEARGESGECSRRGSSRCCCWCRGASPTARSPPPSAFSGATVKRHLANVYEKMGVHPRTEAVRKALLEQRIGLHEITSAPSPRG